MVVLNIGIVGDVFWKDTRIKTKNDWLQTLCIFSALNKLILNIKIITTIRIFSLIKQIIKAGKIRALR